MSRQLKLPTLLVVTDNPSIRVWVKKHFDDQFFILSAERRSEATSAVSARLDFIIVDAAFENCEALVLCKELSQLTKKHLVPIFLITGRLKKSFREQAIQAGVTGFLSDQLDLEEFKTHIASGLKVAESRQKTEDLGLFINMPKLSSASSLKNKFVLNDHALRLLASAKAENTPVALLFLRIDHFNTLSLAHEVAVSFSSFMNELLREKDLLLPASEGGFVVLLSNTGSDAARVIAERLRQKILTYPFPTSNGPQHITVSIVVSSLQGSEKGFHQMIESAVKSLKTHPEPNFLLSLDSEPL